MAKLLKEQRRGFRIIYTYACGSCGAEVEYSRRMDNSNVTCILCQRERMRKKSKHYNDLRDARTRNATIEEILDGLIDCKDIPEVYDFVKGLRVMV